MPQAESSRAVERASSTPELDGEDDPNKPLFSSEDETAVDEPAPLSFPDQGTPPPIPLAAATEIITGKLVDENGEEETQVAPPEVPESAPGTPPALPAQPPQIPTGAKMDAAARAPAHAAPPPAPPKEKRKSKKKRFKKPWFEDFFDDDYLRTLPFMTPASSAKEAEYIRDNLALPPESRVLDVGCGYGRLAVEFAKAGYNVTGLDTSLPLLIKAAEATRETGVEVDFMHQDVREMPFDSEFDGVFCVLTSFGYFDDETNGEVIRGIFKALKPGGKFFLEVINRDYILSDLPSRIWWEGDECVVMDEVEFNFLTSRIESKRSVVFADGRSVNRDLSIRAYCLHELGRLLHGSGFKVVSVTGNIHTQNRFFGPHSPYLIILSQKPA